MNISTFSKGESLDGPFETKMKIEMDRSLDRILSNMDIKIVGLNPGSSYKIEFSIGLYEGNICRDVTAGKC